jgi:hypothetical protein
MEDKKETRVDEALLRTLIARNQGARQSMGYSNHVTQVCPDSSCAATRTSFASSANHPVYVSAPPAPEKIARFVTQEQEGLTPFGILQTQGSSHTIVSNF